MRKARGQVRGCEGVAIHFGKYELLSRINIGGMAEIVKARDDSAPDQPIVAVKRILPHLRDDHQYKTMFLDESRVLAQLDHPCIIKTFEIGEAEATPYIALEYVDGQDARNLFHRTRRNNERVPVGVACYIIAKVCEGLHHAHEQTDAQGELLGLVHRDVSLQNVLLSYDGAVKLTDFGIAMSTENVARTEVGIVKGKFGYMSPEQIKGAPLDRRSDVFAAGICLYELLTGERLFSGESDYKAVERVRNVDVQPPSSLNREIPSSLERIVMKALAKHPRDRYQSANDMRRALHVFMAESRQECSAPELGAYLRRLFAQEMQAAPARMDDTPPPSPRASVPPASLARPQPARGPSSPAVPAPLPAAAPAAAQRSSVQLSPASTSDRSAPTERLAPVEALTGLAAFDNLDPVSTLNLMPEPVAPQDSALNRLPTQYASQPAYATPVAAPSTATPARDSAVRGPAARSAPSVPPIVPRAESIPGLPASAFADAQPSLKAASVPTVDMDWDEDEPSTQSQGIDEIPRLPDPEPGDDDVTRQVRVDETFPGLRSEVSGEFPPTLDLPPGADVASAVLEAASPAPHPASTPASTPAVASSAGATLSPPAQERAYLPVVAVVVGIVAVIAAALYAFRDPGTATLHLTTEPRDAVVTLDGKRVAATASPFVISEVKAGLEHELRVEKPGFSSWSTSLRVHGNQVLDLPAVTLEPSVGAVPPTAAAEPAAAPGAPASAAAAGSARAPAAAAPSAPAAPHRPSAEKSPRAVAVAPQPAHAAAPERARSASTEPAPAARPRASSAAGKGVLRVNTRPWSRVFVDGKLVGNTPQMNITLSAGSHQLKLVNPDFGMTKSLTVEIGAGQTVTKVLSLQN